MARLSDPNSATSTFFVTLSSGDGASAARRQLCSIRHHRQGRLETVDKIVEDHLKDASKDTSGMGMIDDVSKQAKITSITIDD